MDKPERIFINKLKTCGIDSFSSLWNRSRKDETSIEYIRADLLTDPAFLATHGLMVKPWLCGNCSGRGWNPDCRLNRISQEKPNEGMDEEIR